MLRRNPVRCERCRRKSRRRWEPFKDLHTRTLIGAGKVRDGLYHLIQPTIPTTFPFAPTTNSSGGAATQAVKEEVDSRSIYVGNVDYSCTPEEVEQHFQSCGTVNRVTILIDKFGQPKGFAYVEFIEIDAVQNAILLNQSELHGRQLKVSAKRTNIPGMKQYRGRAPNPYLAFRSRGPFIPAPFYSPYGYGKAPRFRRPTRYRPYY